MRIWAIGDLHLSFGVKNKSMAIFGPHWEAHAEQIAAHWKRLVQPEDLVLIPGDISWAMTIAEVIPDLEWIDALPGTKVMIKGNHDYWWGSLSKVIGALPPSLHVIQNNVFNWKEATIGGARLWDTPEYSFREWIEFKENPKAKQPEALVQEELEQKLFDREIERLKLSLSKLDNQAKVRIAMTHYPPIGAHLEPSRAAQVLEQHQVQICVFGHLHNLKANGPPFGEARGVRYVLTSSDYIHFAPVAIL
ncbi:MAG: metallophosphoesterase [Verrucomicrobia bacterium]|nr:metallophosphoesterase [Verrucomicrobiota bacterium]MBU6446171.1 metallophosphoesterase [Verrucomicrobiota bacterium]MDE3047762.1 metallophosphoesterase [Verrucomicrobiota bacterium]